MNQPRIWDYVLGGSAEINNIPNEAVDESSGSPSFKSLFPEITGVPIANGGIPVKRKDINALFKLIGEQIFFIQRGGVYNWDYNATYPKGAIVSHNDVLYRALAESTSRDPTVDSESWTPLIEVTKEDLENVEVSDGSILEKGVVQLSNEISDDETMAVTPKAVKGVLDQLNDLVTQVGSLESTATTLSGQVSQNANDISALQAKDTQIDSDIEALRSLIGDGSEIDLSGIQSQIDAIVEVNNQQNSDIEALQNSQDGNYDEEITALQASDTNQNGQIAELNSKVSNVETDIASLENTTSTLNGSVNANTTNITDLTNRVSSLEGQSPDGLQEQINGAVNRISSLEDLYEEFDLAGIYNYDADITYDAGSIVLYNNVLYKAIVESTGNLPTNASFFEVYDINPSLTQRVSTVEGNVSTNTTNISNLATRVGNTETRISALEENPSGSQDLTEIETRLDTAETNISSLQSADVTLSDRITALENGSGGSTASVSYQHYVQFGMFGEGEGSASDYSQNDWTIDYLATGQAVKSVTTNSGNTLLTIDLDGRYDIKSFRLDVKSDFLNAGGYVRLTIDGVEQTFYNCRYNPVGFCCLGAVFGAGVGGTILMVHRDATDPTRLQYNPVSVGQGLSFFFKL